MLQALSILTSTAYISVRPPKTRISTRLRYGPNEVGAPKICIWPNGSVLVIACNAALLTLATQSGAIWAPGSGTQAEPRAARVKAARMSAKRLHRGDVAHSTKEGPPLSLGERGRG